MSSPPRTHTAPMSIFKQAKNTALLWRSDRAGRGIAIDGSKRGVARCTDQGWGVQLADHWVTKDVVRVTLALEEVAGECYVGVVGRNFNPSDWSAPLHENQHAVVLNAKTGRIYHKGKETSFVLRKGIPSGCVVSVSADLGARSLTIERLAADGTAEATVACDNIPAEVAIAVGFGPGTHRAVILEGITHKPDQPARTKSVKDLWDDDNVQKIETKEEKENSREMKQKNAEMAVAETMDGAALPAR